MLRTAARNFSITISALDLVLCTLESPTVRASDQSTKIKVQSTAYSFDYGYCSTGLFNLLTRALRETVRRNLERLGNFAISQHHDIVLGFFDQASFVQELRRHLVILAEAFVQRLQTNFNPVLLENVGKAALRQAPVQRHLAAFETGLGRVTRTRLLSFFTAPGSFSESGPRSAPDALLLMRRTFGGMEII